MMRSTNKRRRRVKVLPTVLDLLQKGAPQLSKGNLTIQSTANMEDVGHDEAAVVERRIQLSDKLPFIVDGTEDRSMCKSGRRPTPSRFSFARRVRSQKIRNTKHKNHKLLKCY
mmetsp:Transcript_10803/g.24111  ORF Transcript_10803/g.24111 Transcript_10803/m.24111 type:complete len:113 (-) Transcript_10803:48-386(-)